MQTAVFYGASDDLIEIDGVKGGDEFGANDLAEGRGVSILGKFILGGKMMIYAIYDGCWHFSIGPADEDVPLPNWPIRYSLEESGYSVRLEIDVPDDVIVFPVK